MGGQPCRLALVHRLFNGIVFCSFAIKDSRPVHLTIGMDNSSWRDFKVDVFSSFPLGLKALNLCSGIPEQSSPKGERKVATGATEGARRIYETSASTHYY